MLARAGRKRWNEPSWILCFCLLPASPILAVLGRRWRVFREVGRLGGEEGGQKGSRRRTTFFGERANSLDALLAKAAKCEGEPKKSRSTGLLQRNHSITSERKLAQQP